MDIDKLIRGKLHVKRGESLPFVGWGGMFSRSDLAALFGELGYKTGAEIGVRKGQYSREICDKTPGVKLYCIDPWAPYENRRPSQARMDLYYQAAQNNLKGFDVTFMRKASLEAVKEFKDRSLDFVYIDAMHYFDDVMMDTIAWTPKVRVGGIVAGHDYVHWYGAGVLDAIKAYTHAHHIVDWYVTNSKDKAGTPSWFWVNK